MGTDSRILSGFLPEFTITCDPCVETSISKRNCLWIPKSSRIGHVQGERQICILVDGLEHFLIFPYIGNFIIPTDKLIFFRGVAKNHQPAIHTNISYFPYYMGCHPSH